MFLCSAAARGGAEVAGMRLRVIGSRTGQTDESGYTAAQEDAMRFYGFLFDL